LAPGGGVCTDPGACFFSRKIKKWRALAWGAAQIRGLAKRMLLGRKERDEIIEGGYNRYAFHDVGLPKWFCDDEKRHMRCV
jgi:Spb1 C-terminal domain